MGGLFTTPYGPWADMVYSRAASYTAVMKVVKDALDPNKILNPGKLCF
jgi:FAD/FMN-containing dehydrogenase